jgi:hypothetical protein
MLTARGHPWHPEAMKTSAWIILCLGIIPGPAARAAQDPARLEVHEWGTFTVVSGSDGQPLQWYQPHEALSELPSFVYPRKAAVGSGGSARIPGVNLVTKSGSGTLTLSGFFVRMETPVLYFYPATPLSVTAEVTMKNGRITEWFPQHTPRKTAPVPGEETMSWSGELAPPSDAGAAKLTPPVTGTQGAHYARAREVPDAWHFRAGSADEADRFIFYRGAGDALPPYRVEALRNGTVRLSHFGDGGAVTAAFVLDVRADGARWGKFSTLPEMKKSEGLLYVDRDLNTPAIPAAQAQEELAAAMRASLAEAGLSADEARAMVATWRDVWFTEAGTRVLALLPRAWVDSVLPLRITPAPARLARVFVARFEVFTPDREQALLTLLTGPGKPVALEAEKFRGLCLGRFGNAALMRAQRLGEERIRRRFSDLQSAPLQPATAAR